MADNMTLSEELAWRGFINQSTFKNPTELDGAAIAFYWGVDPSADSMTVGNLAIAMMVRHFMRHGHTAYLLVGGATGLIGDPDGKAAERDLKPMEEIARNKKAIVSQYQRLFAGEQFTVVDNYDWFKDLGYLEFLRTVGKHVPMRQMLGREFVQTRLSEEGAGISYAEFSYSLIQGYDFLHLYREHGVSLQVCGADQWGNCIAGVELIRRIDNGEANVWSAPLVVNKNTGVKFGKSEAGAVWLDDKKTSVYQFYQFWLNVEDDSVGDFLKLYTMLDKPTVASIMSQFEADRSGRLAQRTLAYEVTKLVHGVDSANAVQKATEVLFGSGDFRALGETDLAILKAELPVHQSQEGTRIAELVSQSGLANSNSEAMRLILNGGITLNGSKVSDPQAMVVQKGDNLLKRGKNQFAIIFQK
jgi:tyrosyl-tRNA synthetase